MPRATVLRPAAVCTHLWTRGERASRLNTQSKLTFYASCLAKVLQTPSESRSRSHTTRTRQDHQAPPQEEASSVCSHQARLVRIRTQRRSAVWSNINMELRSVPGVMALLPDLAYAQPSTDGDKSVPMGIETSFEGAYTSYALISLHTPS